MTLLFIAHLLVRDDFMLLPRYTENVLDETLMKVSQCQSRSRSWSSDGFSTLTLALFVRTNVPWVFIYIVFSVAFMRKTFVHSSVVSFIQAMNCWQTLDPDQCFAFPHIPNPCAVTQMMLITYKSFQTKCLCWNVYSTHTQDGRARKWFHNLFWRCVWHQDFSFILLQILLNIRIWWKYYVSIYSKII